MPLTPKERKLRARQAAHSMHAQHDSRQTSAPGRAAFMLGFEDQVDPERRLPEKERKRRAAQARRAYFTKLAFKSAKARREKKAQNATNGAPTIKGAAANDSEHRSRDVSV